MSDSVLVFGMGVLVGVLGTAIVMLVGWLRGRRDFSTAVEQATYETLHTAWSAAPALRVGLVPATARKAARHLHGLLGTAAIAITDESRCLAWHGAAEHHAESAVELAAGAIGAGRTQVLGPDRVTCGEPSCPLRYAVVAPLIVDDTLRGALTAYADTASTGLVLATNEVARWVSGQLELAELDRSKARLFEAQVRMLRAQISPHFIYNSLTAIASFVRTDPDRARQLLLGFADFTRYSFRRHGDFTTLAEELRSIDQYLTLERARFGERLTVSLQIAPEVLPVAVPFLCLQPLVENAVQHGMESKPGPTLVTITAEDAGVEALISVEDDGAGMDPERLRAALAGRSTGGGIALNNIDERLRRIYGERYGLVVETAVGAGTKINVRVPKYRAGVHTH